jgi:hypothetical protein
MPGAARHVMPPTARGKTGRGLSATHRTSASRGGRSIGPHFGYSPARRQSTTGGMVRENESGLEPTEPDAEEDEPSGFQSDWPHLSELDLGVCVEPSRLRKPPREGQEE